MAPDRRVSNLKRCLCWRRMDRRRLRLFWERLREARTIRIYIISGDREQLAALAKGESNPELRKEAIRNLGVTGGQAELQPLYAKETDRGVKEEILNAYFIGGDAKGLIAVARAEKDPELKKKAVEKLSLMGSKEANEYLMELIQK